MKRIALFAVAAALAAPAAFAQSPTIAPHDVIDHSAVMISPPVARGLPHAYVHSVVTMPAADVAIAPSSTAVLGGPAAVVSSAPHVDIVHGGTAILDVPAHAVDTPAFQKWMRWEQSRVIGTGPM